MSNRTVFAVLGLLALAGCNKEYLFSGGTPQRTVAPRPSSGNVGSIPPLSHLEPHLEQERGLPADTLRQDAKIVRADGDSLCFEVTLRGLSPAYADLRNWKIHLRAAMGEDTTKNETPPKLEPGEVRNETFRGLVPVQVQTGSETVCEEKDDYEQCVKWVEKPIMSTKMEPGEVHVTTGGGNVCFPASQLTKADRIAIRLNTGDATTTNQALGIVGGMFGGGGDSKASAPESSDGPTRLTFQWDFE